MFTLKKLLVLKNGNDASYIEFKNGLNIIYGPSNCGKTFIFDCIDFAMGSDKFNNDDSAGIEKVTLEIETPQGAVSFTRSLDAEHSGVVSVESMRSDLETGLYSINEKKSMPSLNCAWLTILGIKEGMKIFSSTEMKTQSLTFRTLIHLMLVHEDDAFKKKSALLPQKGSPTALKSALIYLLYHSNCSAMNEEDNKVKKIKGVGVAEFLKVQIEDLKNQLENFENKEIKDPTILKDNVDKAINEINQLSESIGNSLAESKRLSQKIFELEDKISQNIMLEKKCQVLKGQYASDLKRMQFIVDGDEKRQSIPDNTECPFCGGKLKIEKKTSCLSAAAEEIERLIPQIEDLKDTDKQLKVEILQLHGEQQNLIQKRDVLTSSINKDLKPRMNLLNQSIREMNQTIEFSEKKEQVQLLLKAYEEKLLAIDNEKKSLSKFDPNMHFDDKFESEFSVLLDKLMKTANFENYNSCHFNLSNLDVVVNGKPKEKYGKGYRAFINTLVIYGFHEYLHEKNGIEFGTFLIDSPILSLKEKDKKEHAPESMKASLFRMLVEIHDEQIIVIENDIPDIDYKDTNMIHFTGDDNGRYGFVENYRG